MLHRTALALCAALGLALASGARAEDCFNDDVPAGNGPASNDLEPPIPGSSDALLRVTDADVNHLLAEIAAYERRRAGKKQTEEPPPAARRP